MKSVITTAPTYDELMSIYLARRLYIPEHYEMTATEEHLLS